MGSKEIMKKITLFLICAAMCISASASTKTVSVSELLSINIIVKQDITFLDGTQVTVYYKKVGSQCEAWSRDLKGKTVDDLINTRKTSCERVDAVPSDCKCVCRLSVSEIVRYVKKLINAI